MSTRAQPENPTGHQPDDDLRAGPIVLSALLITAMIGICLLISIALLRMKVQGAQNEEQAAPSSESAPSSHEPRLQANPQADLAAQRKSKQDILQSYAWVDRPAGIVRIPIDQAIDRAVEHGLPNLTPAARPQGRP